MQQDERSMQEALLKLARDELKTLKKYNQSSGEKESITNKGLSD